MSEGNFEPKSVRWVKRASDHDEFGPFELQHVFVDDGITMASDGFRLHAIQSGKRFPDCRKLLKWVAGLPGVLVAVDARFLRQALPKDGGVLIRFTQREAPIEIFWKADEVPHYALIMPQTIPDPAGDIPWRPSMATGADDGIEGDEEE